MTTQPAPGSVKISAKIYHGDTWHSMRADCWRPIKTAAMMLGKWSEVYGTPEPICTESGCKFWFHDGEGYNVLIVVQGASVHELRAAYRA